MHRLLKSAKRTAFGLATAVAVAISVISPGLAQRDPLELANAGFLAKDRREFTLAVRLFDEALRSGLFADKQRGILLYSRGASYEALGNRDRALSDFDAAVVLLPDFANVYLYRGIIWGDKGENGRALQDLLTARKLNPVDPLVFNNLGNAYERLGELDQAVENYGRAIHLRSDYAEAYYNRAHAFVLKQDDKRATADYDKAISLQPTFVDAYVNRAVLHLRRRDLKGAFADLDTAIGLNPQNVAALSNRANVHMAVEEYAAALSDLDLALTVDPGNAAMYLARGRAYLFSGRLDESIEDFKTAVRLQPSNPYPVIWLHIARVHKGESDQQELEANAKNVTRDVWPGTVLNMYLGLLDADAIKALALSWDDPEKIKRHCEATFFLGEWAVHSGQTGKARDALREVTADCGPQEVVYSAAVAEMKLLGQ
ncbi:MAG: tetratricopeptide repeat protein [Pseudomonadota bacterium]